MGKGNPNKPIRTSKKELARHYLLYRTLRDQSRPYTDITCFFFFFSCRVTLVDTMGLYDIQLQDQVTLTGISGIILPLSTMFDATEGDMGLTPT